MKQTKQFQRIRDGIAIIKQFSQQLGKVSVSAYSGQTAYMLILSFFPFIMVLLSLIKYTPVSEANVLQATALIFPSSFQNFIGGLIDQIFQNRSNNIFSVTLIIAIWLGSKSFLSLIYGLNSVYHIRESRNWFILRFFAVIYTAVFAILLISSLTVLVFGNRIFFLIKDTFPLIGKAVLLVISLRSAVSFIFMLLFFTILYWHIPNTKHSFVGQLPGAILATVGWMGFSYLYSFYVDHISNYSSFYGTMTTIAFLMVWLYACMYILFLGGLLNYILKEYRITDYLSMLKQTYESERAKKNIK